MRFWSPGLRFVQIVEKFVSKIVQIFDCKTSRHGNMIVGKTGSGKTTAWKILQQAMNTLHKQHPEFEQYTSVRTPSLLNT